jgi:hypothetical protein
MIEDSIELNFMEDEISNIVKRLPVGQVNKRNGEMEM